MSAQFFKIFLGVFLAHVIVLSVVWVGFSAPFPRPPAAFIYEGALPANDAGNGTEGVLKKEKISEHFALDHAETSYLNHWTTLRVPSKPFSYDHLGF